MVNLISSLRAIKSINALVIGDFVLDTYIMGRVGRVSPEAPVPVLLAKDQFSKPGMAGNVALNLASLGAKVFLAGRVGNDEHGQLFLNLLKKENVNCDNIVKQEGYITPVKQRMIAHAQQLLRVDFESTSALDPTLEKKLLNSIKKLIKQIDVIAVSDYLKGCLTPTLLQSLVELAKDHNIPIVVDPKGKDFSKYRGVTLIKPNLLEAYKASQFESSAKLDKVAKALLNDSEAEYILITRSSEGMTLYDKQSRSLHFPTKSNEVIDVTGAGDTVLAMLTMALGNSLSSDIAAQLANIAASVVIKKVGCVSVEFSEIAEILLEMHTECKIFNEDHLFALSHVLSSSPFILLALHHDQDMSSKLFETLRQLSEENPEERIIVYIEAQEKNHSFISLLASLHEVDFIIQKSHSLAELCDIIKPKKVFSFDSTKLLPIENPQTLLQKLKKLAYHKSS